MSRYDWKEAGKRVMARVSHDLGLTSLLQRVAQQAMEPRLLILMYHRIADAPDRYHQALPTAAFVGQIAHVAKHYPCLTEEGVCAYLSGERRLTRTSVVVTFDDGYRDTATIAQPILKRHGVPAMVFLATSAIGTGKALWPDRLGEAFKTTECEALELSDYRGLPRRCSLRGLDPRIAAQRQVTAYAKQIPQEDLEAFVTEIEQRLGIREQAYDGMLSWDEVVRLHREGMAIGGHTINHRTLSRLPLDAAEEEIVRSKQEIERRLGCSLKLFCYPNGTFSDITPQVKRLVQRAGFVAAVAAEEGANHRHSDTFSLLRVPAYQKHIPRFAAQLVRTQLSAPAGDRLPTGLRVEVIDTSNRWDGLAGQWEALVEATHGRSLFLRWDWLRTWWEVFGAKKRLWILAVWHPDGRLLGVAPWYLRTEKFFGMLPHRVIRWLGDGELVAPEYLDVIARPEDAEDVARTIGQFLASSTQWDRCVLRRGMPESATLHRLQTILREAGGWERSQPEWSPCPYVELPQTWEEYVNRLSPDMRHNIKRRRKKLDRDYPGHTFTVGPPDGDVRRGLMIVRDLHRKRKGTQGIVSPFEQPLYLDFHLKLAERLERQGALYLAFLTIEGKPVAAQYGFRDDGILYAYQMCFDPAYGKSGVAQVLLSRIIETEIQRGTRRIDFLRGAEAYKYDWAAQEHRLVQRELTNRTVVGRLAGAILRQRSRLGTWVRRHAPRASAPKHSPPAHQPIKTSARAQPVAYVLGMSATGLAIARDLGRRGIPVIGLDAQPNAPALKTRYATIRLVPSWQTHPESWVETLVALGKDQPSRGVVFPAGDAYALLLSTYRARLEPYFHVVIPSDEIVRTLPDKRKFHELATRLGVRVATTAFPDTTTDLDQLDGAVRYPCALKPIHSHLWASHAANPYRARKLLPIADAQQLRDRFQECQRLGLEMMVQELIPGDATCLYGVVAYLDQQARPRAWYVMRKLRQHPVDFGLAALAVTVDEPEAARIAVDFLQRIGYRGIGHVELKRDPRDGAWVIIEANTRPILFGSLGTAAGMNLPHAVYCELAGQSVTVGAQARAGVKWIHLEHDVQSYLAMKRQGRLRFWPWAWSLLRGRRAYAFFAWDDPAPWLSAMKTFVWRLRRRTFSVMQPDAEAPFPL